MRAGNLEHLDKSLLDAVLSGESARAIALLDAGANPRLKVDLKGHQDSLICVAVGDVDVFVALLSRAGPEGLEGQFNGELLKEAITRQAPIQVIRAALREVNDITDAAREELVLFSTNHQRQDAACEMIRKNWLPTQASREKILITAAESGMVQLASLIFKELVAGDHDKSKWSSALCAAVSSGTVEICEMLIAAGANPDEAPSRIEGSLLGQACAGHWGKSHRIAKALVDAGANIEAKGKDGCSVLMWAAKGGCVRCAEVLLKAGAKVDARDDRGGTALMWACSGGHLNVLRRLLAAGANPNASANGFLVKSPGVTAAMICCERGQNECLDELIRAGANLEAKDAEGRTVKEWIESCKVTPPTWRADKYAACEALTTSVLENLEISKVCKVYPQGEQASPEPSKRRRGL